jgi:hypothetical protein
MEDGCRGDVTEMRVVRLLSRPGPYNRIWQPAILADYLSDIKMAAPDFRNLRRFRKSYTFHP